MVRVVYSLDVGKADDPSSESERISKSVKFSKLHTFGSFQMREVFKTSHFWKLPNV